MLRGQFRRVGGSMVLAERCTLRSGAQSHCAYVCRTTGRGALRIVAQAASNATANRQSSKLGGSFSIESIVDERNNQKTVTKQMPHADKPGTKDDSTFPQHWSVRYWRDFRVPEEIRNENLPLSQRTQALVSILQEGARKAGVFDSPQALAYWTYHLSRMGFFAATGLLGAAYSQYQSSKEGITEASMVNSNFLNVGKLLTSGLYVPVSETLLMFYQDYQNIRTGVYKMPWDMTTRNHRQTSPSYVLNKVTSFVREAAVSLGRRGKNQTESVWMDSNMYPDYYLSTWHYQTDGWLSDKSASIYETSTETVFTGRQDAMQRQSLIPISEFVKESLAKDGAGLELLDVATGTGRYATFVKDNYPKMGITQLDLSPFYLQKARENMDYWRRKRGGPFPEDTVAHKDKFLHAPAEKIPVPDESYNIVLSTYLFHEIPEDSRRQVAKEMARACKPGGMVILTDGVQFGDRPVNDASAGNFQAFNEPNWGTHVATDYGKLFTSVGLVPHKKILASGTKVLSFKKMSRT